MKRTAIASADSRRNRRSKGTLLSHMETVGSETNNDRRRRRMYRCCLGHQQNTSAVSPLYRRAFTLVLAVSCDRARGRQVACILYRYFCR